jgi:hypothetical protein
VMRRAVATGSNAGNMLLLLTWYWGCLELENIHPLQGGYLRRKYRRERRPTLPIESPLVFYPRYVADLVWKHMRLAKQIWRLGRFRQKLKSDPNARNYTDLALTPVTDHEFETYEMFSPAKTREENLVNIKS